MTWLETERPQRVSYLEYTSDPFRYVRHDFPRYPAYTAPVASEKGYLTRQHPRSCEIEFEMLGARVAWRLMRRIITPRLMSGPAHNKPMRSTNVHVVHLDVNRTYFSWERLARYWNRIPSSVKFRLIRVSDYQPPPGNAGTLQATQAQLEASRARLDELEEQYKQRKGI